ncbi:hypothetical protein CERZMDRAFT_93627 [Cercospora zeae-maydis SCOH1-5]|uniref:F-box domain-containing protein n=1 Tax=Cercospora zeae-maydis SCOH1-5 TaxID=717836 RepID=A0A6A6FSD5_9PEZI|nr:hypothetical protein CERZMDRAFT_93627 [Cercospora zeae-maydis SCOH1-5]
MIVNIARAFEQVSDEQPTDASTILHPTASGEAAANRKNRCRLEELPRELRDCIYRYTAFFHVRDVGIGQTPGLLRANRQMRSEFRDILCNSKLLTIRYYDNGVWQTSYSSRLLCALLECKNRVVVDFAGRLLGTSRDQAERLAEFNSKHIDPSAVVAFIELAGTDGRSCINVAFARGMINASASEHTDSNSTEGFIK